MASLIELLTVGKKEILVGEIEGRSGEKYSVNLRDRTVDIKSSLAEILTVRTQVFVTDVENELRIIAKTTVKNREREEVILNG